MPRTADELMNHHIESMINMKKDSNLEEALSDYSEELIAITRLDGRTRTMGHDTLTSVMRNSLTFAVKLGMDIEHAVEKLNFLYRQSTDNYITLVASLPPFSSFPSFTFKTVPHFLGKSHKYDWISLEYFHFDYKWPLKENPQFAPYLFLLPAQNIGSLHLRLKICRISPEHHPSSAAYKLQYLKGNRLP